mgnify:CR=1 FL=1
MSTIDKIEAKLEAFISRYYLNQLLRGFIFFVAIGLSYLLLSLLIEYFLWLKPLGRAVLFWSFIVVELALLIKFIFIPLARLLKLAKGINLRDASKMIGTHFPEVSDKLTNTLQLKELDNSDLALASIEQRGLELEPIPFSLAIDFKKNLKYLKYAVIPVLIFIAVNFSSSEEVFGSSYKRMVNYNTAYEPPAPFSFLFNTENLKAIENEEFMIHVNTQGKIIPDVVQINIDGANYFMKQEGNGNFSYTIEQPTNDVKFYFIGGEVVSRPFNLDVVKTPLITSFSMHLDYPNYTGKVSEVVTNTGNVSVPEGTNITWELDALETENIEWITRDTLFNFVKPASKEGLKFNFSKFVYDNLTYSIATSNADLKRYETLDYNLNVVKDAYPEISVDTRKDTVTGQQNYHLGTVSDDYGIFDLKLYYYPENESNKLKNLTINVGKGTVDQFMAAFPDNLQLTPGVSYTYYFEVRDNDAIHKHKRSRSDFFNYKKLTVDELEREQLEQQENTINELDKSLEKMKQQDADFEEMKKIQKEKGELNYNDQQQLKSYLQRQKDQSEMMEQFSQKLKKNLEEFDKNNEEKSEDSERLQERLKRNEERLKKQEKLLDELEKLRDKINKEELSERLDKLSKQNKNSEKNLKQLLELTKRFYVQKKAERIAKDINELGEKQEKQADKKEENNKESQDKLNKDFKDLEKQLDELEKDNNKLKKPIEIPKDISLQESIKEYQKEALDALKESEEEKNDPKGGDETESEQSKKNKSNAQKKQKEAGKKMKQLSKQMEMQMMQSGGEQLQEDTEMLRQILDNLVIFSFNEEDLMNEFKVMDNKNPSFSSKLIKQSSLKENFEHIDDSLFALSLRTPQLEDVINEELTNIDYSLNQSLERLSENRVAQGTASQQYVVTGANTLADMLSEILNNMQQQLSGQGQGQGSGPQLQDIITSQEELNKQMGKGKKDGKGENGQESGKNPGSEGEKGEQGSKGSEGNKGEGEGKDGENSGSGNQLGNGIDGLSEEQKAVQFEIYKQQEEIRQKLLQLIKEKGLGGNAANLAKEMERIENMLLDGGLDSRARERMLNLKHQLLKLQEASQIQGQENKRESSRAKEEFINTSKSVITNAAEYFNNKEILNREALPLEGNYKTKVQAYFNKNED